MYYTSLGREKTTTSKMKMAIQNICPFPFASAKLNVGEIKKKVK